MLISFKLREPHSYLGSAYRFLTQTSRLINIYIYKRARATAGRRGVCRRIPFLPMAFYGLEIRRLTNRASARTKREISRTISIAVRISSRIRERPTVVRYRRSCETHIRVRYFPRNLETRALHKFIYREGR